MSQMSEMDAIRGEVIDARRYDEQLKLAIFTVVRRASSSGLNTAYCLDQSKVVYRSITGNDWDADAKFREFAATLTPATPQDAPLNPQDKP